mmetsp:Transcript_3251/g.6914  ORF Transcript_3251/g.6914 Transcript_3251/m.6914 type:complete len:242 (+) Transcript_3251:71-796(+)|eukprot:CAMPEP_0171342360 /NCGR_PEP_ID=MMETSP0878-20121228/14160_1 /TAXON_ID=67004 /ORGANISM="Thalassiosira weissflogii, Strain CCMP1336" /LENGTH=241 /DNA_ID=CAMNT_0011845003 /DNA_START=40 /DNA_END=765 /DNA_ORIENTATION=-
MSAKQIITPALRAAVHVRSSKLNSEVAKSAAAYLSSAPSGGKHVLPDLPYDYAALEPCISAETMEIHHSKHHNTYVTNLNATLEKLDAAVSSGDVSGIISLQSALKFNGGGHVNHTLFWENLTSKGNSEFPTTGPLKEAMDARFGDLEGMKKEVSAMTVAVQGSGWGWLGFDKKTGRIEAATCANQDPLQATTGLVPLLGIDVWEHAYYVDYRNVRPNYVSAIWDVINWKTVEERLVSAKA